MTRIPNKSPCINCTERWVTSTGRCHTTCERYISYTKELEGTKAQLRKERNFRQDVDGFMLNWGGRCKAYNNIQSKSGAAKFGRSAAHILEIYKV